MAALKAPLIIAWSVVLCLPSLYVFSAMGGADLSGRRFLALVSGFAGMLALLLAGLLPIAWLFSVSSRSLEFVVWLQVFFWLLALSFAGKYLRRALTEFGARGAVFFWLPLFGIVSFQVATFLRPVLWREPGAPCFDGQKMFFLQHLGRVLD